MPRPARHLWQTNETKMQCLCDTILCVAVRPYAAGRIEIVPIRQAGLATL